ncbi:hypothetical protein BDV25DRAFT_127607 [Aspergillus avenaceus]|uniref:Uncharacterized protein n=1 Tax=Aspergillus avenaceus TaxID=36643 RepID=A0A5N6U3I1_ASPAV|nr:hypothetical protein BDV25DRAFT_127607 [Aspergillus avenaceus]
MSRSSLLQSRWAPGPDEVEVQKPASTRGPSLSAQDLSRFMKIVARLKWKLPFLAEGYRLATLPTASGVDVAQAEIMFKIDFFEYYALLERAIVHLLGVFGVRISGAPQTLRLRRQDRSPPVATHRYHANVLEALESESCPLHPVLGTGDVHEQLRQAKELRNRWKTADLSKEEQQTDASRWSRKEKRMPLASYDFENILTEIFNGLEEGCLLAQEHIARTEAGHGPGHAMDSEADWDFIVDAMDWEAV